MLCQLHLLEFWTKQIWMLYVSLKLVFNDLH